jgi:galactose oxidase-like protein
MKRFSKVGRRIRLGRTVLEELLVAGLGVASAASGPLTQARVGHTATLLPSGKVLIAGGEGPAGLLNNAELFDP